MKIICEYCKNTIDTDKESKCPNCMASYADNKEFKERINTLKEEERLELERKKIQNETAKRILEHSNNIFKSQKYIYIIILLMFLIPFILGITIFSIGYKQTKNHLNTRSATTKIVQKEVKVNFKEYAETSEYKVQVDKILDLKKIYDVLTPSEGKKYKVFHLIIENKLDRTLYLNQKINCIVDDFAQQETYYFTKYPSLPSHIDKGLKAEGYVIFEVPKEAKTYDIKYGDLITIHIEE